MQGIPFAVQTFIAGAGILDWLVFHGSITAHVLRYLGV